MATRVGLCLIGAVAGIGLVASSAQADLIGYWSFDASSAVDGSGNSNNGTVGGSITFSGDVPFGNGLSAQNYSTGAANVITIPTSPTLESIDDQLTVSFWMKAVTGSNWVRIFQHGTEGNPSQTWLVDRYSSNAWTNMRVDTIDDPGPPFVDGNFNQNIATTGPATFAVSPAAPEWHHLVYVLDNGTWRKYVDGVESTGGYLHGAGLSNTRPLYIFGRNGGGHYVGQLDDIGVWSDALTTGEARSIYTVPMALGLAYDIGDMTALWDIYDSRVDGTIHGIPWQFTSSLPDLPTGGAPSAGDAYLSGGIMYLALGNGSGLAAVPEPSTFLLAALGLAGLALFWRRRKR